MKEENRNLQTVVQENYRSILRQAVAVIEDARTSIAKHVNGCVSSAYWQIGMLLYERKIESGYGDSVFKQLSVDLKQRFTKMEVSTRQLWNMRNFYLRYKDSNEKVLRSVALLPWSHNVYLLSKNLDDAAVLYYAQETIEKDRLKICK